MSPVLIAGAGPTGLAAALFLAKKGVRCRIIDKASEPSGWSKALAVNPRTLHLLEGTGVTEEILKQGRPVGHFFLRREGKVLAKLDAGHVDPKYPMVAFPQSKTEELLAAALAAERVEVERGVELTGVEQDAASVRAHLTRPDGRAEMVEASLLFAADGAHSTVRQALKLDFPGSSFPEPWKLADIRLETPLDMPEGVDLYPKGFFFALAFTPTWWRFITNIGEPLDFVPKGAKVAKVDWSSEFHISHRIVETLAVGRIALGGDAAHLHSPVGARGMNLGIEDAYVFAELAKQALHGDLDKIATYAKLRHEADKGVVQRVEAVSRMARGEGLWTVVREVAPPLVGLVAPLRHLMEHTVTGLDHEVRLS